MTHFVLMFFFAASTASASSGQCIDLFKFDVGHQVSSQVEKDLKSKGFPSREARGYSILVATMVASAAATTYISSSLPVEFQFVSQFLAQVSTLGVYVFGAPIWEPLSSGFRKMAFGVRKAERPENPVTTPAFEELWRRTQETYSLNAQMSRNVINQFLISVQQNFYEAHRAVQSKNSAYAADQIAAAAFRLRTLFREIEPTDISVASAVRTSFTNHTFINQEFVGEVSSRIRLLDEAYQTVESQQYYGLLLRTWLETKF